MQTGQVNVEYFFLLIYNLFFGTQGSFDYTAFKALLTQVWFWVVVVGYALSVIGLFVIVYVSTRLFELRKHEEEYYRTPLVSPESAGAVNARWERINSLMEGGSSSQWREAITEADIMLDDVLTERGYNGDTIGDRLKNAKSSSFHTLNEAWEAHKVRNEIAHSGSAFDLTESLAQRTIARYEAVFRELKAI